MAQFDVYLNQNEKTAPEIPFLLDLQTNLLDDLTSRVVAPLYTVTAFGTPARHLNPQFTINQVDVVMSSAELAGVPVKILGEKIVNLEDRREGIIAALDFLFTGI
jgi:toxin CcdB